MQKFILCRCLRLLRSKDGFCFADIIILVPMSIIMLGVIGQLVYSYLQLTRLATSRQNLITDVQFVMNGLSSWIQEADYINIVNQSSGTNVFLRKTQRREGEAEESIKMSIRSRNGKILLGNYRVVDNSLLLPIDEQPYTESDANDFHKKIYIHCHKIYDKLYYIEIEGLNDYSRYTLVTYVENNPTGVVNYEPNS